MIGTVRTGLVAASFALGCAIVPATAAPVTLKFATIDTPYAEVNIHIHHPWAERVNHAGKGVLRIEVVDGAQAADFTNVYRRVLDDRVQIGWALQSYLPVAFPLTNVAALPLVADDAQDASVALFRLWKSGALASEYHDIVPLKLCTTSEAGIHLRSVPKSNEGLDGLKIIEASRIGRDTIAALGGTPVSLQTDQYHRALATGAADGVLAAWPLFHPLNLPSVTSFHIDVALGGTPCMVFMAKKTYLGLPAAARHVLAARSTEQETMMLGRFWDETALAGRFAVGGLKNQVVVAPSPDQLAAFKRRVAPAIEAWVRRTAGGAAVLAKFRAALAAIAAGR